MAVWETEDESTAPMSPATPATEPASRRTPSRNSRRTRRSVTPPGKHGKSSSPPPFPADKNDRGSKRSSRDISTDENISILDPRRFTPTLHANLVSEILSLRRDQEEKTKTIECLETSLHSSREESESLQASLLSTAKESRSLKRQLALLEGGTSSALGELARERDEAVDSVGDTKKRLEAAQKKLRSQEEDSERVHEQWAKEKEAWEEEKRRFERKIHIAETRLKVVLDEVAAFQAAQTNGASGHEGPESEIEESAKETDAASVRTMSMTNSIRFSVMNGGGKPGGNSLADELNFDGDYDDETDYGGRESALSQHRHMRNMSRESVLSRTHRRNQSSDSLIRPGSVARGRLVLNLATLERLEDGTIEEDDETQSVSPRANYVETGVQYSPPPSPKDPPAKPATPEPSVTTARFERATEIEIPPRADVEIEANQRRKRVHIGQPLTIVRSSLTMDPMVNGSSQTAEEPLSPPRTPKSPYQEELATPKPRPVMMVTSSTQTDLPLPLPPLQPPPSFLGLPSIPPIPSISIIPPTSRPSTPREPRLPQLFKDFGCQVSMPSSIATRSTAMQTEEIRIDRRLDKLPAHLHPSAVTSRPVSPNPPRPTLLPAESPPADARVSGNIPSIVPPRNPRRLASKGSLTEIPSSPPATVSSIPLLETHDSYPGNNDDGPLSSQQAPVRRPPRLSSLFAGFDGNSSDEVDEFVNGDFIDSEYRTALSAPKPKSSTSKRSSGGYATSPEQSMALKPSIGRSIVRPLGPTEIYSSYSLADVRRPRDSATGKAAAEARRSARTSMLGASNKASVMRKAAMIQNGIATHQRARSPSIPEALEPPFPIPTRASSRRPPATSSAPSEGRSSPTNAWHKQGLGRNHYRANSIRKVRSAAVLPRNHKFRRQSSRSPPPLSPSTEAPESPGLPPLSYSDVPARTRDSYGRYRSHMSQPSTNTANTANTIETGLGSVGSSNQQTSVVDAIAQTMVGEWMFKYVRRRKSFGVADTKGDESSNDRHKRWVWLAPYERAILWSSKQPASGSALMGKSGRKLTIQSVLDVKDDNPAPKGVGTLFNRSILILTPQRALKFTATNAERHYIWLASLSFLAHSQQAIPEITGTQPLPLPLPKLITEEFELPKPKIRKPGIRDSIRLTKAKATSSRTGAISVTSSHTDSVPPSIPSSVPSHGPIPEAEVYHLPVHVRDMSRDAAEPPFIPRFQQERSLERGIHERANQVTLHGRKRSNTGGHVPPPLSFRGFSGPASAGSSYHHAATNSTAGNSIGTAGSSDIYNNSVPSSGMTWATGSVRTSEASSRPGGVVMNNFFDAIGTVRMEAFISPMAFSRVDDTPYEEEHRHQAFQQHDMRRVARRRSKELRRRVSRSRGRDSYQSRGTKGTDDLEEWYLRDDPFKGF